MVSMFESMVEMIAGYGKPSLFQGSARKSLCQVGLSRRYRYSLIEKRFAEDMKRLKGSDDLEDVVIGMHGEKLQNEAFRRQRSESQESTDTRPILSPPLPILPRTYTLNSSPCTSSCSPPRLCRCITLLGRLPRCACGAVGICGCARRANSYISNRKNGIELIVVSVLDESVTESSPHSEGTAWIGYRSSSKSASPESSVDTRSNDSVRSQRQNYSVCEDDMIGEGRYRCSKSASSDFIIDNAIKRLGDMADIVGNFAGDQLVPGYTDLTYGEVARIKFDREFPKEERAYKQEVSEDGTVIQHGFPVSPKPFDDSEEKLIRQQILSAAYSAQDRTAEDFNSVHSHKKGGKFATERLFNARCTTLQDFELQVSLAHENRQLRPRGVAGGRRRVKFADQQNHRRVEGRTRVVSNPQRGNDVTPRPIVNKTLVPPIVKIAVVPVNIVDPPVVNADDIELANNNAASQDECDPCQNTNIPSTKASHPATPQLITKLGTSLPSKSLVRTVCENAALPERPIIRRQPSGLRNEIMS